MLATLPVVHMEVVVEIQQPVFVTKRAICDLIAAMIHQPYAMKVIAAEKNTVCVIVLSLRLLSTTGTSDKYQCSFWNYHRNNFLHNTAGRS